MANEFVARKGLIAKANSQITGSLSVTSTISATAVSAPSFSGVTLSATATSSTDSSKSLYTMTSTVPVEFRSSDGNTLLYLDETNERIGVGTSSPATKLHVAATSGNGTTLINTGGIGSYIQGTTTSLYVYASGGYAATFNNGNVGIGTTGPDRKLDVLDASNPQLRLTQADGTVYTDLQTTSSGYLKIEPSGLRTGINMGTDTPAYPLQVYGRIMAGGGSAGGQLVGVAGSTYNGGYQFWKNTSPTVAGDIGLAVPGTAVGDDIQISTFASGTWTGRVTILSSTGNVGIGTTGPDRKLDILDASNPQLRLTHTDGSVYTDFQTDSSGYLTITPTGGIIRTASSIIMTSINTLQVGGPITALSSNMSLTASANISFIKGATSSFSFGDSGNNTSTSGDYARINTNPAIARSFSPTSGTATWTEVALNPIINQTGGANGITRGLYINPTLTAAANWRAIETTQGSLKMADTYLAGSGSLAGSLIDLTQTWNTTGTPTAIKLNVTDTASNSSSVLMDLQVGGTSKVKVEKTGRVVLNPASGTAGITWVGGTTSIGSTSNASSFVPNGTGLIFYGGISTGTNYVVSAFNDQSFSGTSGTQGVSNIAGTFAAGAGSAVFRPLNIAYTINNSGAQSGTATGIFLNATETALNSMTHNLIDLQVGGSTKLKATNAGLLSVASSMVIGANSAYYWTSSSSISSPSDGVIVLSNNAGTGFTRLQFGGTTSSFPSIKRNSTALNIRLADDSADAALTALTIKATQAGGYITSDGSTGATGTFTTADAKTVTVKDGIITSIV